MKIALLAIGTAKYYPLALRMLKSADEHFFCDDDSVVVDYLLFTDRSVENEIRRLEWLARECRECRIEHSAWPFVTLHRYHSFLAHRQALDRYDYLFYCDADTLFVGAVGAEIIGDGLCAVQHPCMHEHSRSAWEYEKRSASHAYTKMADRHAYYCGAVNGGRTAAYIQMAELISEWTDGDKEAGIVPVWWDESYLNRYMNTIRPSVELPTTYYYPERWTRTDLGTPRIVAKTKNHAEIRS